MDSQRNANINRIIFEEIRREITQAVSGQNRRVLTRFLREIQTIMTSYCEFLRDLDEFDVRDNEYLEYFEELKSNFRMQLMESTIFEDNNKMK